MSNDHPSWERCVPASLAVILLACLSPAIRAAMPQTSHAGGENHLVARGHDPKQLYFAIGGAEVNAFNFNLVITLSEQLGFGTPVDGDVSLALSRVYNSSLYQEKAWQCSDSQGGASHTYLSIPRQNPMGLGWSFHLGKIVNEGTVFCRPPSAGSNWSEPGYWVYEAPDGARHTLVDGGDGYYYSQDGSMLRAEYVTSGPYWVLYHPNGLIYELRHQVSGCAYREVDTSSFCGSGTWDYFTSTEDAECSGQTSYDRDKIGWYTTLIRGREENGGVEPAAAWVAVSYHSAPHDYVIQSITDSHHGGSVDREVKVTIETNTQSADYGAITKVEFPAPPEEDGTSRAKAAFNLLYEAKTLDIDGAAHVVRLLKEVQMPQGYTYRYEYRDAVFNRQLGGGSDYGGQLSKIHYPSGKIVNITYDRYHRLIRDMYDVWDGGDPGSFCDCADKGVTDTYFIGVKTKEEYVDGDDAVTPRWPSATRS
jgi:hypothetical protein